MILQCDDRQLRAGLARRRATKVSNYQAALTTTTGYYWPGALYAPRICLAFCRMPLISSIEKRRVNLTF
jgi:hypothetical protein